jgi:uncharacterized caspase-like protein
VKRRRLLQAGIALPLARWAGAWAQTPERNLTAAERKEAPGVAASLPLLAAPRRALVIGNSSYSFGPLKNPANDARAIGEELRRSGFEVTTGLDLPRKEMLAAIRAYAEALTTAKAVGVFYFAGHGVQLAWRNYLLPTDAQIARVEDIEARCVDVNAVIEGIAKAANPMNVVILDACRENPFAGVRLDQKGLSQLDAPPATLLAYATAPGNLASDGEGANGLYTEQLLKELKVPEARIEDVFKRVRLTVRRRSNGQQIPWESTSLEEDFWFLPPKDQLRLAQEQAARIRKARDAAERERLLQAERERRERLEADREEAMAKAYEAELALWEKVAGAKQPGPIEDYLRRYPSGNFAELAQLALDALLARQGEKPIRIASSQGNPFTQGTARADLGFKVGDSYSYVELDRQTRREKRSFTHRVTEVTETEVIVNRGSLVLDRFGSTVKAPNGRRFSQRQELPLEYAVGRRWRSRYSGTNPDGSRFNTVMDFRIARREKITVPAGTFDCFVVEGNGYSLSEIRNQISLTRWMAPEKARRPIASDEVHIHRGRAGPPRPADVRLPVGKVLLSQRTELASFSQS